jgi:LysR family transcriptional regulator, hydrogen peroxide-inducible genes activator
MTIQQLRYIVALDQERNFSKAAEHCSVSQPGLTIQLKNLEEEIGVRIFDRHKVPLVPTLSGREIITRAQKILREVEDIRDFVIHQKNTLDGEVTIGVISTLSPYLVPSLISQLKVITPDVHYVIKEGPSLLLVQGLETGQLDIALMATPTGNPNVIEHTVFREPFLAYLNASHPQAKQERFVIEEQPQNLLLLQTEFCFNAQLLDICGLGNDQELKSQFDYDINSIETLKNLVKAEQGFAVLPMLSVIHELDNPLLKPFDDPMPVREISLVVADTFPRKLLLEKISEAIWKCLPEPLKKEQNYQRIRWNDSPYFVDKMTWVTRMMAGR